MFMNSFYDAVDGSAHRQEGRPSATIEAKKWRS